MRIPITRSIGVLATVLMLAACNGSDGSDDATTSSSRRTTSTSSSSTTPTAPLDTSNAVFPVGASTFTTPEEAARSFAVDYVGFTAPIVGTLAAGDARSGEVPVRATSRGTVTTVLVRQLDGRHWWVLGASSPNLVLESPAAYEVISSPVTLRGRSTAFEAQIRTEVRQDGAAPPLGSGTAMGGSMGEMGPFTDVLSFTAPSAGSGAVMLSTRSMMDGTIAEATVVRVAFAR
ncbi:MAG: Gmad2 immunoglobulin-like domain-containing protein [Actinomycetes bacterium]